MGQRRPRAVHTVAPLILLSFGNHWTQCLSPRPEEEGQSLQHGPPACMTRSLPGFSPLCSPLLLGRSAQSPGHTTCLPSQQTALPPL